MSEITKDEGVTVELTTMVVIISCMYDWINRKQLGLDAPVEELDSLREWAKVHYTTA